MYKKFVSIFHNNVKASLRNSMFDIKNKYMVEVTVFAKIKNLLNKQNIGVNTYDVYTQKPSYKNIHFDLPYPLPSNFHAWKMIFLNRRKNILICFEPPIVNPFDYMKIFHPFFTKIYTWNDDLVDNKKIFKILSFQSSTGWNTSIKEFKKKKFLVLINSNKEPFFPFKILSQFGRELYSERIKAIDFFEEKIPDKFYLYGRGWNKRKKYNLTEIVCGFKKHFTYKGAVENKWETLSNFKYCICFENMRDINGYITEKILDCFKAKCVPIYWGAPNIEKYIPKDCFIDFRDFGCDYEKLLNFLNSIDETKYNQYINNIEKLLADKKFVDQWFEEGFAKFFLEDILEIKSN